jgi:hypothetical protein
MADDDRRTIIDRANRMMKQSQVLRKLADELMDESRDLRIGEGGAGQLGAPATDQTSVE